MATTGLFASPQPHIFMGGHRGSRPKLAKSRGRSGIVWGVFLMLSLAAAAFSFAPSVTKKMPLTRTSTIGALGNGLERAVENMRFPDERYIRVPDFMASVRLADGRTVYASLSLGIEMADSAYPALVAESLTKFIVNFETVLHTAIAAVPLVDWGNEDGVRRLEKGVASGVSGVALPTGVKGVRIERVTFHT